MEENESSSAESSIESSASSESAPASQTQEAASPSQEANKQSGSDSQKLPPFHEHPRFKELIDSNRSYKSELDTYKQSITKMEAQLAQMQQAREASQQKPKPSYEQVLSRLQGIDPEFGEFQKAIAAEMQAVPELKQQLQQFAQWKQNLEQENFRTQVRSKITDLYEKHKVPVEDRAWYERSLKGMAAENPTAKLEDLDNYFKQTHDEWSKYNSERERKLKASYVQSKTKDVTPTTQTGGAPAGIPGKMNTQEDRIKALAAGLRAAKQKI